MVAIDFPATPALGQEFMAAGIRYAWNGYGWVVVPATGTSAEAFVLTTGDTMTGDLIIHKGNPRFTLNKNAAGELAALIGQTNGSARWQIDLGDRSLEAGGNSGSDFVIEAYNDSGLLSSTPIKINRSTGLVTVLADPVAALGVATKQYVDAKPGMVLATLAEARAGVVDTKAISPKTHAQSHMPAFHAISQGMSVSPGSFTAVTTFAEDLDTDNRFNGVSFQPNAAGWYEIGGMITVPSAGADYVGSMIWFNGSPTIYGCMFQVSSTQTVMAQTQGIVKFNGISDYVELVGLSDHPVGRFYNAVFYGHRLFA
jgi:hypothetical protein